MRQIKMSQYAFQIFPDISFFNRNDHMVFRGVDDKHQLCIRVQEEGEPTHGHRHIHAQI